MFSGWGEIDSHKHNMRSVDSSVRYRVCVLVSIQQPYHGGSYPISGCLLLCIHTTSLSLHPHNIHLGHIRQQEHVSCIPRHSSMHPYVNQHFACIHTTSIIHSPQTNVTNKPTGAVRVPGADAGAGKGSGGAEDADAAGGRAGYASI